MSDDAAHSGSFPSLAGQEAARMGSQGLDWLVVLLDPLALGRAVTDVSAILFSELIAAYPDAKVILMTRDPAGWFNSYAGSLQTLPFGARRGRTRGRSDAFWGFTARCAELMLGAPAADAPEDAPTAEFAAHYERVKAKMLPVWLLEYEVGQGWERLCAFLGEGEPKEAFPRMNDAKTIRENINAWAGRIFHDT
ncbi:hypothetical protein FB451DRAFT_1406630 [Mycena latifolia]|nr:hypothetical protein FB451DRAFT_1406630 [Mycena latifolia]